VSVAASSMKNMTVNDDYMKVKFTTSWVPILSSQSVEQIMRSNREAPLHRADDTPYVA
jgi:hypothetical protein